MSPRHLAAVSALVLGLTGGWREASAQTVDAAPSAAQQCLTRAAGHEAQPIYPEKPLMRGDGARFAASLTFHRPDAAPWFKVLGDPRVDDDFIRAARDHAAGFRVPCMPAGETSPVVLRQEYVFTPNDGRKVVATKPTDEREQIRQALARCVRHLDATPPDYPEGARQLQIEGKVFLQLSFDGPEANPGIQVHAASHARLQAAALRHAQRMRMPCHPGGEAVATDVIYQFSLHRGARTLLKDAGIDALLRAAAEPVQPAFFDFNTMGCPFDLRLTYQQPYRPNQVGQLDSDQAERRPFLAWLAGLRLKLDDKTNTAVLGETMTVHVPCGTLDR